MWEKGGGGVRECARAYVRARSCMSTAVYERERDRQRGGGGGGGGGKGEGRVEVRVYARALQLC